MVVDGCAPEEEPLRGGWDLVVEIGQVVDFELVLTADGRRRAVPS